MKIKGFACLFSLLFCTGHVVAAQDDALTPEQEEAIRNIALDLNQNCPPPAGPAIPDGSTATRDEMVSSQKALQGFIDEGNTYLDCLEGVETSWGEDISNNQKAVLDALYNRAVTGLQDSAKAFNDQLHIYQGKSAD